MSIGISFIPDFASPIIRTMTNSWHILCLISVILFILPLAECGPVYLHVHRNTSCIEATASYPAKTTEETNPICDFLRKNDVARPKILVVLNENAINQYSDELKHVIGEQCYFEIYNFGWKSLLKAERRWMKSISIIILDTILCTNLNINLKMRHMIMSFRGRMFVMGLAVEQFEHLRRYQRNHKTGMKRFENRSDLLIICEAASGECVGEPSPIPSSTTLSINVATRKFAPLTVAENGLTLKQGKDSSN